MREVDLRIIFQAGGQEPQGAARGNGAAVAGARALPPLRGPQQWAHLRALRRRAGSASARPKLN